MTGQRLLPYIHIDGKRWDHYYYDSVSQIIYFEKRHNGKKIKFSTKEKVPNGIKAKRFANAEFDKRIGKTQQHVRNLIRDELPLYYKMKQAEGWDYDTMNNVRRAVDEIGEYWNDYFPSDISDDSLTEWYAWWKANKTIQMENVVKYMRNFCKYLSRKVVHGKPLLPAVPKIADPDFKKNRRARKKKKERLITSKEFKTIMTAANTSEERLAALFMYTMATRITETLEMGFGSEIFLEQKPPIYKWSDGQNKADLDGFHALHPVLIGPLTALKKRRASEGTTRVFPQSNDNQASLKAQQIDWDGWRKRAGLDWHWTSHTFRHTCLSNLFNDPKNPQLLICKLYRISLKEAEETYVKPTVEGIERMRAAFEVKL